MSATLTLLVWLVKATALLMLATGITLGLRRAPAGARYLVWLATLIALLLVPAISSWSPLPLPFLPSLAPVVVTSPSLSPTDVPSVRRPTEAPAEATSRPVIAAPVVQPAPQALSAFTLVLLVWLGVGLLLVGWLTMGALAVRRIVRGGRVLTDESWLSPMYDVADRLDLEHAPRLVMSSTIEMPFACGIARPTIVLPATAEQWSDERRRVVLFHELAHVRRRDLLGHTVGRIVCAFYWFHPMVWSAAKRLRAESERACDDLVLACGGARASDYANHLLEIVTAVRLQGAPATALPMADKREFEGRMLAILDPAVKRATPSRAQSALLTVALGVLLVTIAAAAPARRIAAPAVDTPAAQARSTFGDTALSPPSVSPTTDTRVATSRQEITRRNTEFSELASTTVVPLRQAAGRQPKAGPQPEAGPQWEVGPQRWSRSEVIDTALLGRILRTDKDAGVRKSAAWVLSGHRDGIPLLLERLRVDEDDDVREMAAWALAQMGSADVAAALGEALRRDSSDEVRATAAWGLGQMGSRADAAPLLAALADPSADVRQRALWGLGRQDLSSAPPKVVAMLSDESDEVRLMAAWVLGVILDKSTIPAIRAAFLKERDSETLQAEFRALSFMGDRSQAVIDRAMSHEDPEIRARAVRMIAGQGPGVWPWPWPWPQPRPQP